MSVFGLSFYLLLCYTSCINHIDDDEVQDVSPIDLRVQTRTATETGVPYPLTISAFDSDGQCATKYSRMIFIRIACSSTLFVREKPGNTFVPE